MTVKLGERLNLINQRRGYGFAENFLGYVSAQFRTSTLTDSGAVAVLTTGGGGISITPSDGTVTNNDEAYVGMTSKSILFANLKPVWGDWLIQYTEGNTDDANVIVGFSSSSAANALLDDGGGPPASYTGLVFFKVDGDTLWQVEASVGGTQTTKRLTSDISLRRKDETAGGSTAQRLSIGFVPRSSTQADVFFYIDDELVCTFLWTYTSAAAVGTITGLKNGADTTVETLNVYQEIVEGLK